MADTRQVDQRTRPAREEDYRTPPVDIYETDDRLVLLADMPGVGDQGIEVSVEEDALTIIGRLDAPHSESAQELLAEFRAAPFRRVFTLSTDLKRNAIEGKIQNGVLCLTLPKADEAKVRKIPIKT